MKNCLNCGELITSDAEFCSFCGTKASLSTEYAKLGENAQTSNTSYAQPISYQQPTYNQPPQMGTQSETPILKYKLVAGLLAIFLGGFGIHKFYMDRTRQGFLYLLFFWTGIPFLIGIFEGLIYLTDSTEIFNQRILNPYVTPKYPERDHWMAILLAFLTGWFGGHLYFLEDRRAIYYTLFLWTGIPFIIGFIEGLIYIFEPMENFVHRYGN